MNKLNTILKQNHKKLSIYFTAGFPELDNTTAIIKALEASHVDFIEVGLPYSDPLADDQQYKKVLKKHLKMVSQHNYYLINSIRLKINVMYR